MRTLTTILTLTLLTLATLVSGQSKFSIGLTFSPNCSYRILSPDSLNSFRFYTKQDLPRFGITTGIRIKYDINEKLNLRLGFLYSEKGTKVVITKEDFPTTMLFENKLTVDVEYVYWDIPLECQMNILSKEKLKICLTTGVSANIHFKSYAITQYDKNKRDKTDETDYGGYTEYFRKMNFSANLGIGMIYNIKKIDFLLQPIFRQDFVSAIDLHNVKLYHNTLGLEIGIFYKF